MEIQLRWISGRQQTVLPFSSLRYSTGRWSAGMVEFETPVSFSPAMGDRFCLYADGKGVFSGYLFSFETDGKLGRGVCYDRVKYLLYKDTKAFYSRSAGQIAAEILKEKGLPLGGADLSGGKIPGLIFQDRTLLGMIRSAAEEANLTFGENYVFFDDFGKLFFRYAGTVSSGAEIAAGADLTGYRKETDIDGGTFTRFKLLQEDGRSGFSRVTVGELPAEKARWGTLQYFERINSSLNQAQVARKMAALKASKGKERKTLSLEAAAAPFCRAGKTVGVSLDGKTRAVYLIEESVLRLGPEEKTSLVLSAL